MEKVLTFTIIGSGFLSLSFITWAYTRDFNGWPVWLCIIGLLFWLLAAILFSEHEKREAHLNKLAERYRETRAAGGIIPINDNRPEENQKIENKSKDVPLKKNNRTPRPRYKEDKKTNDR